MSFILKPQLKVECVQISKFFFSSNENVSFHYTGHMLAQGH